MTHFKITPHKFTLSSPAKCSSVSIPILTKTEASTDLGVSPKCPCPWSRGTVSVLRDTECSCSRCSTSPNYKYTIQLSPTWPLCPTKDALTLTSLSPRPSFLLSWLFSVSVSHSALWLFSTLQCSFLWTIQVSIFYTFDCYVHSRPAALWMTL